MLMYVVIGLAVLFVLLLCFCLAVASFAFDNFYQSLQKLDQQSNSAGLSTLRFVDAVNHNYFQNQLTIAKCERFKDCYTSKTIALSEQTMNSNSLASLSIVSHELGHAKQDFSGNKLKKHLKFRRYGRSLGLFFMPLMLTGAVLSLLYVFSVLNEQAYLIAGLSCLGGGFLIFLFAIILKYREIQIEKEASDFALEYLKQVLSANELKQCQDFLKSARMTYWASLFRTMFSWTFMTKKDKMFR